MIEHPKLYKRTNAGKVQAWWIQRDGAKYRTCHGYFGGATTTSEWTTAEPKNVGQANHRTAEMQALAEVISAYEKKVAKGYTKTATEAASLETFSPMLALKYEDRTKDVAAALAKGPVFVQPKLDGIRCIATRHGLVTRNNKPIVSAPHIVEALAPIFKACPDVILDGELYNHELKHDFNQIVSLVKKTKPTDEDNARARELVEYHVYDTASDAAQDLRFQALFELLELCPAGSPVFFVDAEVAHNTRDVDMLYESFLADGYEGAMIRLDEPYEQKRSKNLLKYKPTQDAEFEIVEICEGNGNRSGMAGYAVVRLPNGNTCHSNIKGDREFLRHTLASAAELVGKQATIEFFGFTPDGALRFPRIKAFHETERM